MLILEQKPLLLIEKQIDQNAQINASLNQVSDVKLLLYELVLLLLHPQAFALPADWDAAENAL